LSLGEKPGLEEKFVLWTANCRDFRIGSGVMICWAHF
jgi:hypothetical protein